MHRSGSSTTPNEYAEPNRGDELPSSLRANQKLPKALENRPYTIKQNMFVILLRPEDFKGWMDDHPFWLAKVVKITPTHHHLYYYGDKFLGSYYPLTLNNKPFIDVVQAGSVTYMHWNAKMVSGGKKISQEDLKVVSIDRRIPWTLAVKRMIKKKGQQEKENTISQKRKRGESKSDEERSTTSSSDSESD